jgi:hypothetical protein
MRGRDLLGQLRHSRFPIGHRGRGLDRSPQQGQIPGQTPDRPACSVDGEAQVLEVRGGRPGDGGAELVVVVRLLAEGGQIDHAELSELPEVVGVFVVSGADDFVLHVAVPNTDALYAFVIDRLTERPEIGDVRTAVVYEHIRRPVLEPLDQTS